ncbi:putative pogo transposable element [Lasiosphaeria ovina]|uniref:Pogo transposable element n=1 Tax=Lasiosphaeria ovina TaxID=92902 RepID=A0AAE0KH33_9PEZI|nr:putative pogo transposable element [Lasiosphaeria ovina]
MSMDTCPASPPGYFYRGDCKLLCRSAEWFDVIIFFLGNYVAHIPTVVSRPGQSLAGNILFPILALLFPGTGIAKAMGAIESRAIFAPTKLQMAARAGALYMVAPVKALKRRPARPRSSQDAGEDGNGSGGMPRFLSTTMHGVCRLPKGYCFIPLGKGARFANDPEDDPASVGKRLLSGLTSAFRPQRTDRPAIACDYNVIKIIVAIVQLAFALVTLYRTRGDQITMYGYAAFGLTVAQYAWMSLLNLIGSLVCPNYPSIFVVESQTLKDLRARIEAAGETASYPLSGTVGELTGPAEEKILRKFDMTSRSDFAVASVFGPYVGTVPIAIIGGLSKFSLGGSTLYQRVWTMMWLVFGFLIGPFMILDYGVCIRLREVSI